MAKHAFKLPGENIYSIASTIFQNNEEKFFYCGFLSFFFFLERYFQSFRLTFVNGEKNILYKLNVFTTQSENVEKHW